MPKNKTNSTRKQSAKISSRNNSKPSLTAKVSSKKKIIRKPRQKATKPVRELGENEQIVEFSYNSQQEHIVARFLNGESFIVRISDLPKKLQSKHPLWEKMQLWNDRSRLLVSANSEIREVTSKIIRERGINLDSKKILS